MGAEGRIAGDVEGARRKVGGTPEEHASVLDVVWPFFQKLDVFEVVRVAERAFVEFFEAGAGEGFVGGANFQNGVREQVTHRGGGAGEIGVGEIEADAGGGAADGETIIDKLWQFAEAAAANDFCAVGGRAAVVGPAFDFRAGP